MTDLWHTLHKSDLSFLEIVAEKWGLHFSAPDARQGLDQLVNSLLNSEILLKAEEILTEEEQEALIFLDQQGGKADWDQFIREYGEIRQMGAGRMERERPHLQPLSAGESLWYRALIGRGFFETETGPQEFAYLPDDLRKIIMPLINPDRGSQPIPDFICRVAAPRERKFEQPGSRQILDHLCSLLAGIRMDLDPRIHLPGVGDGEENFYRILALSNGLVTSAGKVSTEHVRQFFELSLVQALDSMWRDWRGSTTLGELELVPDFKLEGELSLDHPQIREKVLSFLRSLPLQEWWSLESFITQVKERDPDFLRSGGEYESWFVKKEASEQFLSGFQHWDEVEGTFLRYFLTGPLHWLGFVDLGAAEEEGQLLSFRLTDWWDEFASAELPTLPNREPDPIQIRSQGEIRMTPAVPHKVRYQIARFCDWQPYKADAYHFRISPESLGRAEQQGLRIAHLLSLLDNHTEAIPPNILAALQRWENQGAQGKIENKLILRVGSPEVLASLRKTRAERYILEQLGPTAVVIRPGSQEKVAQALLELGLFSQVEDQNGSQT